MLEFWGAHNAAIQSVIKLPSGVLVTGTTSNGGTGVCLRYNLDKLCSILPLYILVSNL